MKLHSESQWYVFPGYGGDFRDMGPWVSHWQEALPGHFRFSPGFAGGGVLGVPLSTPQRERNKAVLRDLRWHHMAIYGLALGNEAGQELSRWISCALPESVPSVVAKLGLAEAVPKPKVKVTVEHVNELNDARYLIVVPKA
ncbi:hypothetical protein, partial [Aquisphaera insulae]|uniref:hypothetical protein n=1 Tax=Aquisphaera insulae TaxID=2712864 RepID=UPI00196A3D41